MPAEEFLRHFKAYSVHGPFFLKVNVRNRDAARDHQSGVITISAAGVHEPKFLRLMGKRRSGFNKLDSAIFKGMEAQGLRVYQHPKTNVTVHSSPEGTGFLIYSFNLWRDVAQIRTLLEGAHFELQPARQDGFDHAFRLDHRPAIERKTRPQE
ncbi:MAG TPA: hypothetical protein VJI13_02290 [Candidatus Norongarragalinales archaeon]|nr:hypothetical protein [Candidatus Norongarragalinales archaeon]